MKQLRVLNNYFFDTEFYENGETIELISIGMVREYDLNTLYLVNKDFDYNAMVQDAKARGLDETISFLDNQVFNNLDSNIRNTVSKEEIKIQILNFVRGSPQFWASCSAYDWVVLSQLFGVMVNLPSDWPRFCNDLAMLKRIFNKPEIDYSPMKQFKLYGKEHNALYDACEAYCKYLTYKKQRYLNPVLI